MINMVTQEEVSKYLNDLKKPGRDTTIMTPYEVFKYMYGVDYNEYIDDKSQQLSRFVIKKFGISKEKAKEFIEYWLKNDFN